MTTRPALRICSLQSLHRLSALCANDTETFTMATRPALRLCSLQSLHRRRSALRKRLCET
jgi:hypothetical protein